MQITDFNFNKIFKESLCEESLEEIIRKGAKRVVKMAVMEEFETFLQSYSQLKDQDGKRLIVRNGYHKERNVMSSAGILKFKIPRISDRRAVGKEERLNFHSSIIPPYLRRTSEIDEFIPYLYLKGISSGDFSGVLSQLLGREVYLSATTVSRLKKKWEKEHAEWSQRDLSYKRYVYWWADGIYFSIRMEKERNCMLVIMGVLSDGKKELVAIEEGPRESELSWRSILMNLKNKGLQHGPLFATGDGALGFWKALEKEFPQTVQQRCWVHKTANVLDKLPKSVQPEAKSRIHEIYLAPGKELALKALDEFVALFGAKYPKAVACLLKDKEKTLAFYDFPAEHWRHIRSTNAIESTFATVRLRTYKTRGCLSRQTALAMVFKLAQSAEKRWQRIHQYKLLAVVVEGGRFVDGVRKVA